MPIRPPALDDRSFEDLVEELLARIPAHAPEWTHPRPGDPGRTLIELFAWLADTILYRANLIPERQRLAYLRLLGMAMKPARAARGLVALQVRCERVARLVQVPPGATIAKPVPFQTLGHCTAYPLIGRAYVKRKLTADEQVDFDSLLPDLQSVYLVKEQPATGYVATEVFAVGPDGSAAVDIVQTSVDQCLWIALMAPSAKLFDAARNALGPNDDPVSRAINVGLALALDVPEGGEGITEAQRIPLLWEMSTGSTAATPDEPDLVALEVLDDGSQGLTRSGVVRLALPPPAAIGAPSNDPRLNLKAGVGDAPPRLDSPADAETVIAWLRLRVRPGHTVTSLRLAWAGINAVEIEQYQALPDRALGVSDGGSDQRFDLGVAAQGSVDPASFRLVVYDSIVGSALWVAADDLGRARPLDNVYRLDPEAGTVQLGDGVHGRVPAAGSRIVATGLRAGGGSRGNLPAGTLARLDTLIDLKTRVRRKPEPAVDVVQPLALQGGADAETLDAAERRIPAAFRHRDRAVTAEDYRALAREAPGFEVARVEVLPRFKPHERIGQVPGAVSVMVWPGRESIEFLAPYPRADRPLLAAVYAWLDARRPLATELYAIGCEYRSLGIAVAVQIRDGHAREQVLTDVRQALRRYLWPLPLGTGGVDGNWPATLRSDGGYPLGRSLTDRELEVVVARVDGVAGVSPVRLFEEQPEGGYLELPGEGKALTLFDIEDWQLPELTALAVIEGVDAPASVTRNGDGGEAGSGTGTGTGSSGSTTVYLPVVPELC